MTHPYLDRPWCKLYDPGIPHSLAPYPETTLHALLRASTQKSPVSTALISSAKLPVLGRSQSILTYGELDRLSDSLAAALIDLGLKKGDRVALVLPNVVAFPISFYAVLKAGGVVVGTNPTYPAAKMAHQINDCDAEIIITLSLFYKSLKAIQPQTRAKHLIVTNVKEYLPPLARRLFTLAREKRDGHRVELGEGDLWFQDLLATYANVPPPQVEVLPDDRALLQYTGGTTGVSKGAILTHRMMTTNTAQLQSSWLQIDDPKFKGLDPSKVLFFAVLPLFHAAGLVAVMAQAVATGSSMLLVPNPRDIHEVVDLIGHYRPQMFVGVPALYNAINNHPRVQSGQVKLDSLIVSSSGTAPLSPATKRLYEELSGNVITEGYGMSECLVTHANPLIRPTKIASVGFPYPDTDCRIVSLEDALQDVPVGQLGEVILYGPTVMQGYHKMPTETANVLRPHPDGRVWLHTGDIGYMDEEGYFYLVDRKKDMALIGGYNVYPSNVEKTLAEHPAILEAGVAAIAHPEKIGQEALKAWVVFKPGQSASEADLIAHCEARLAPYEVPRRYAFVEALPKTAIGKILRRELAQSEAEGG